MVRNDSNISTLVVLFTSSRLLASIPNARLAIDFFWSKKGYWDFGGFYWAKNILEFLPCAELQWNIVSEHLHDALNSKAKPIKAAPPYLHCTTAVRTAPDKYIAEISSISHIILCKPGQNLFLRIQLFLAICIHQLRAQPHKIVFWNDEYELNSFLFRELKVIKHRKLKNKTYIYTSVRTLYVYMHANLIHIYI